MERTEEGVQEEKNCTQKLQKMFRKLLTAQYGWNTICEGSGKTEASRGRRKPDVTAFPLKDEGETEPWEGVMHGGGTGFFE